MATRIRGAAAILALIALPAIGCATSYNFDGGGGSGGEGGEGPSGPGAGGSKEPTCAIDCSTLEAPECSVSACNKDTLQCEVVPSPKGTPCDDGLFCTVSETCEDGVCGEGYPNTCGLLGDACSHVTCDEESKACAIEPAPDDLPCQLDGDLCVVNAVCKAGACQAAPKDCFFAPMPDVCHVGVCNPMTGACDPTPGNEGGECPNDGDLCMEQKTCIAGECKGGVPKDCSALTDGCNNGACDPATGDCFAEVIPAGGFCMEAADACNNGVCDANGQCQPVPANDGAACDDSDSCTLGETCLAGACQGGVVGNYVVYFSETFADNAAGWTFPAPPMGEVNEWAIGPAIASVGSPTGYQDPGEDHTPTADNGIAGVVIGGYANEVIHAQHYIESPVINTDVPGPVYLDLWRWLNSDYTPYMKNTIDVWNGTSWQNVWSSAGPPAIQDATWTHVFYDITAHKSATMKVRVGFDIQSDGVYTVSGWNIDDVVIANAVCAP